MVVPSTNPKKNILSIVNKYCEGKYNFCIIVEIRYKIIAVKDMNIFVLTYLLYNGSAS